MFRKIRIISLVAVICIIALLLVGSGASAQEDKFPDRPITLIVNYGGGGSTDLSARALANAAEKYLGTSITVVNKSGGGGVVGIIELQNAKNDGYTIGSLTYSPMAITPLTQEVPYTVDDFDYILAHGGYLYGIAVREDSPYKTIKDLVEAARNNPGLAYSSSSLTNIIPMFALEEVEDVKFTYVPFSSGTEAVAALLGGHVEATAQNPSELVSPLKTGEARLLASTSNVRWDIAPDVLTLKELGYDIETGSWMGLGVPAGVPQNRLQILQEAFEKAAKDSKFQEILKRMGIARVYLNGDEYKKLIIEGSKKMEPLINELGLNK
ncbi:tripartite tricarboxylate transporter substrate binding protein [Candidatus Atribacteria bacterium 1244-E10-H5-B2]|nr:MAG: tripartite tricarboxylate transporter substrate binding protein [Candidatus Atribacteria bacterium 1244-E10-H5-B2]